MMDGANIYLVMSAMAVLTYASRLSGYYLFRDARPTGRLKQALDAVPPAVLTAVIAPNVFLGGPSEMVGGAVALGTALARAPLLVTIMAGMASVAFMRIYF
jgi:uncharacterized membrane protein